LNISFYDARPYFEKALLFGIANGIIDQARVDAIQNDGPKGIVQIARYFGTEFLRPELETAKDRMVNLISLHLEDDSGGDLALAAVCLRDHSLLSRSKAGSDMLKAMLAMPDSSHFGMRESDRFTDDQIPLLARWTLRPLADYRAELVRRGAVQHKMDSAFWFAQRYGLQRSDLTASQSDCEAVVRTCLLMQAAAGTSLPSWSKFEALVNRLRKQSAGGKQPVLSVPRDLPANFLPVVQSTLASMNADDLSKILDTSVTPRKLFFQNLSFLGRYFWVDDGMDDLQDFERSVSKEWLKLTQGHTDDGSLLTLFLSIAAGATPKTALTQTSAGTLVRKIRKSGLQPALVTTFINDFAPHESQGDYRQLWLEFLNDAQRDLLDERDTRLVEAMSALRMHCNVVISLKKPA
jgi:hypothetical protein